MKLPNVHMYNLCKSAGWVFSHVDEETGARIYVNGTVIAHPSLYDQMCAVTTVLRPPRRRSPLRDCLCVFRWLLVFLASRPLFRAFSACAHLLVSTAWSL